GIFTGSVLWLNSCMVVLIIGFLPVQHGRMCVRAGLLLFVVAGRQERRRDEITRVVGDDCCRII
ncbi:hypothetical protein ACTE87_004851, partial [Escherichia albertii]